MRARSENVEEQVGAPYQGFARNQRGLELRWQFEPCESEARDLPHPEFGLTDHVSGSGLHNELQFEVAIAAILPVGWHASPLWTVLGKSPGSNVHAFSKVTDPETERCSSIAVDEVESGVVCRMAPSGAHPASTSPPTAATAIHRLMRRS